jgi:hypothetical protein
VLLFGVDDFVVDHDQLTQVLVGPCENALGGRPSDEGYAELGRTDIAVSTVDDDKIGLILRVVTEVTDGNTLTSLNQTDEFGDLTGRMTVVLASQPEHTVLFTVTSSNPKEAKASPSIVAFAPENWNIPAPIVVMGEDDDVLDGNIQYDVEVRTLFTHASQHTLTAGGVRCARCSHTTTSTGWAIYATRAPSRTWTRRPTGRSRTATSAATASSPTACPARAARTRAPPRGA